jgi:hypothetical protein
VRARASRRFQTSIRVALSPHCSAVFLQSFPNTPSLGRSSLIHALSTPPAWTHPESSFVGLATAENHGGTAGLKPESSISHSGVDALQSLRQRSFPLSQLDWLRSKHNHRLCSTSSLSHHHNPHDNASSVITTASVCLGSASMRCDLANRRNASWRRGWLLPGCAADGLRVGGFPVSFLAQLGSSKSRPP